MNKMKTMFNVKQLFLHGLCLLDYRIIKKVKSSQIKI